MDAIEARFSRQAVLRNQIKRFSDSLVEWADGMGPDLKMMDDETVRELFMDAAAALDIPDNMAPLAVAQAITDIR